MQAAARLEAAKKKVAKGEGKASDCKTVRKQTTKTGKGRGRGRGRGKNKATEEEATEQCEPQHHEAPEQREPQHEATEQREPQHHEAPEQREPQHEATEQREPQHEAAEQREPQEAAEPKAAAKSKTSKANKSGAAHTLSAAEAANQQLWNEQDVELCVLVWACMGMVKHTEIGINAGNGGHLQACRDPRAPRFHLPEKLQLGAKELRQGLSCGGTVHWNLVSQLLFLLHVGLPLKCRFERFWAQVDGWADLRLKGHLQRGGSCQLPRESERRGNHIDLEEGRLDSQLPASLQACRMDSFGFLLGFWFHGRELFLIYMLLLQLKAEVVA